MRTLACVLLSCRVATNTDRISLNKPTRLCRQEEAVAEHLKNDYLRCDGSLHLPNVLFFDERLYDCVHNNAFAGRRCDKGIEKIREQPRRIGRNSICFTEVRDTFNRESHYLRTTFHGGKIRLENCQQWADPHFLPTTVTRYNADAIEFLVKYSESAEIFAGGENFSHSFGNSQIVGR